MNCGSAEFAGVDELASVSLAVDSLCKPKAVLLFRWYASVLVVLLLLLLASKCIALGGTKIMIVVIVIVVGIIGIVIVVFP